MSEFYISTLILQLQTLKDIIMFGVKCYSQLNEWLEMTDAVKHITSARSRSMQVPHDMNQLKTKTKLKIYEAEKLNCLLNARTKKIR